MMECKTGLCSYKKVIGGALGILVAGTVLFFSCGKADEKKTAGGTDSGEAGDVEIHLTFEAYTDKTIETFRVYAGTSKDTLKVATDFAPDGEFDFTKPEITVESNGNTVISALLGSQGCFQLRAVKDDVESDASNLVCTDL